ncbi:hypothetical protein ZIOFF_001062 [Zingiber officinale]|uniref:Pentatricopeptide repeat-containing protein n=1 Tax=Zingiber officinale TaxID=94328 RepID=A0A8J5LRS9_ZINOF|nr:hypothetical protein ZIOFF_001062 [Zingiber officinale]
MTAPRSAASSSSTTAVSRSCTSSPPSALSVAGLLNSCRSLRGLQQIHSRIIRKGLEQHPVLATRFLSLCAAFAAPAYASSAFERLTAPNLITWNALLSAHAQYSPLPTIVALFNLLRRRCPMPPDAFTFPSLLSSCSRSEAAAVGSSVHATILRYGLEADVFVGTALIDFYGKCRELGAARKLFDSLLHRNEVSWTVMIAGYLSSGDVASAMSLFYEMPRRNVVTWNSMIDGYVKSGDLVSARTLFDEMPHKNAVSYTSMIDGYAKAGDLASAKVLFEQSPDKDLFSWSAMISGYAQNGRPGDAMKIFLEMYNGNIKPDDHIVVGLMSACSQLGSLTLAKWVDSYVIKNGIDITKAHVLAALINMNVKCGNMERAAKLFESMRSKDLVSYSSLMQGYSIHGAGHKALELFSQMLKEGLLPDNVTFTVVLTACSYAGLVEEGKKYFELMKHKYLIAPSSDHYACMVDLLGRAGRLKEAYELIKSMDVEPHAGAWGALLGACKTLGDIELGEVISKRLFELEPTNAGNYVVLSNIYAVADRWADVSKDQNVSELSSSSALSICMKNSLRGYHYASEVGNGSISTWCKSQMITFSTFGRQRILKGAVASMLETMSSPLDYLRSVTCAISLK